MAARASIYHTSSYKSNVELKALLQRDIGMRKMSYTFYHRGVLGNTPFFRERIEVRSVFTCVSTISNTQPVIRLTLNPKPSISTSITSNWILHLGLTECSEFQKFCQKAWEVIYNVSHEKTIQLIREVKLGDVTEPNVQYKRNLQRPNLRSLITGWTCTSKRLLTICPTRTRFIYQHG